MRYISVSELNNQIKSVVDSHFEIVYVIGEVSKVTYYEKSGHLYFTLKDKNSSINCAMWKNRVKNMKFTLKEGDEVLVFGAINIYVPRGEYKIIVQNIELSGEGALQAAFERLKEELQKLGYFDEDKKKPLPLFPKKIALITSSNAAALQDMLKVAKKRWRLTKFYLFNSKVQGEGAAEDIAKNIKKADEYRFEDGSGFDLIIVGRGGGSKEDLWAFNERVVADAIFNATTPIISAVGHEIDYLISDFVADKRAATPSNAIEIALPDENELLMNIDEMIRTFDYKMQEIINNKQRNLNQLKELYESNSINKHLDLMLKDIQIVKKSFIDTFEIVLNNKFMQLKDLKNNLLLSSPINKLKKHQDEIEILKKSFFNTTLNVLRQKQRNLDSLKEAFKISDPKQREKEGFGEVIKNHKRVSLNELQKGDIFLLQNTSTIITAKVLDKK